MKDLEKLKKDLIESTTKRLFKLFESTDLIIEINGCKQCFKNGIIEIVTNIINRLFNDIKYL